MQDDYYECTKSMLTCIWALSLFGAEQLARLLAPRETLTPRYITKVTCDIMQQSAEVCRFLMPGQENRLAWQEFQNKLQAFDLFEHVDVILRLPSGPEIPLVALVEQAERLGPYLAVWAMEGLGRYYAETCWEHAGTPQHLLSTDQVRALPPRSLIPLHTGLGLSLAGRLLAILRPQSPESDLDTVLQQFVALCQQNAVAGYAGAALEALGLVTRLCYPQRVRMVDRRLSVLAPDIVGYFWHGVGRGLYFLPLHALPCSSVTWRAVEMTQAEAPHALGRLNALGGLAWAITLVNIRHPAILEACIQRYGDVLSANDAFFSGVSAALMIWYDMASADPYLKDFLQYQPDAANTRLVQLWHSQVRGPAQEALQRYYGVLKAWHGLGEVFRYQPLPALVDRLVGEPVQ
ncbi:MAG TPA: hypothetical protein VIH59_32760 [Candidatus Tectomicrobia bacterium]|jgi:hypothetical protein